MPTRCVWCKRFLSKKQRQATVKNPDTFYCFACYQKGLDEEYAAMGLHFVERELEQV